MNELCYTAEARLGFKRRATVKRVRPGSSTTFEAGLREIPQASALADLNSQPSKCIIQHHDFEVVCVEGRYVSTWLNLNIVSSKKKKFIN